MTMTMPMTMPMPMPMSQKEKDAAQKISRVAYERAGEKAVERGGEKAGEQGGERASERGGEKIGEQGGLEVWEGTLARTVNLAGCGVHSGKDVHVVLHPRAAGTGIVLRRGDLANGQREIPLRYEHVEQRRLCTKVVNNAGSAVSMVEHLMCALAMAQIDNLLVELDADELPILDGSAEPWLAAILEAGVVRQQKPRSYLQVCKPVEAREDDRYCRLLPLEAGGHVLPTTTMPVLSVDFLIEFPHPTIGRQRLLVAASSPAAWREEIASARTFAFQKEIEQLREQNFALGGSLDNAVLVGEEGIVNPEGLRYKDEFVRHKILDLCGDLYLAGMPILAHIEGCKSGHRLNNRLLHSLFRDAEAWREVFLTEGATWSEQGDFAAAP